MKPFDKEGWTGWNTFDKKGREAQGVALGKRLLVTMDVNRAEQQAFDLLWKKVGFDALQKVDR